MNYSNNIEKKKIGFPSPTLHVICLSILGSARISKKVEGIKKYLV